MLRMLEVTTSTIDGRDIEVTSQGDIGDARLAVGIQGNADVGGYDEVIYDSGYWCSVV